MTDGLKKYFLQMHISSKTVDEIICYFKPLVLNAGDLFLKDGRIADTIAFIEHGILRTYENNNAGKEHTKFFFGKNQFITNIDSYLNILPSRFNIEALTPCKLFVIHKESTFKISEWSYIFNDLLQKTLIEKINIQHSFKNLNAKEKYETFLRNNGEIVNQIPLQYIASYLGITPQTLSRIRRPS